MSSLPPPLPAVLSWEDCEKALNEPPIIPSQPILLLHHSNTQGYVQQQHQQQQQQPQFQQQGYSPYAAFHDFSSSPSFSSNVNTPQPQQQHDFQQIHQQNQQFLPSPPSASVFQQQFFINPPGTNGPTSSTPAVAAGAAPSFTDLSDTSSPQSISSPSTIVTVPPGISQGNNIPKNSNSNNNNNNNNINSSPILFQGSSPISPNINNGQQQQHQINNNNSNLKLGHNQQAPTNGFTVPVPSPPIYANGGTFDGPENLTQADSRFDFYNNNNNNITNTVPAAVAPNNNNTTTTTNSSTITTQLPTSSNSSPPALSSSTSLSKSRSSRSGKLKTHSSRTNLSSGTSSTRSSSDEELVRAVGDASINNNTSITNTNTSTNNSTNIQNQSSINTENDNNNVTEEEDIIIKRKAQNRAAQRAFRERKEARVRELEQKLNESEKEKKRLFSENERLKKENTVITTENQVLLATTVAGNEAAAAAASGFYGDENCDEECNETSDAIVTNGNVLHNDCNKTANNSQTQETCLTEDAKFPLNSNNITIDDIDMNDDSTMASTNNYYEPNANNKNSKNPEEREREGVNGQTRRLVPGGNPSSSSLRNNGRPLHHPYGRSLVSTTAAARAAAAAAAASRQARQEPKLRAVFPVHKFNFELLREHDEELNMKSTGSRELTPSNDSMKDPLYLVYDTVEIGETMLGAGAVWELIMQQPDSEEIDIGLVMQHLKGKERCDGFGPVFRNLDVLSGIDIARKNQSEMDLDP